MVKQNWLFIKEPKCSFSLKRDWKKEYEMFCHMLVLAGINCNSSEKNFVSVQEVGYKIFP